MQVTEQRTIGGLDVRVTQLAVLRQAKLASQLIPFLGSAMSDPDDGTVWARAAAHLLDAERPDSLLKALLEATQVVVDGRMRELRNDEAINDVFRGRLGTLIEVAGFSLEVNFADFFVTLTRLAREAIARAQEKIAARSSTTPISPKASQPSPGTSSPAAG